MQLSWVIMSKLIKDTRGANLVEYIILVGVVALISIAAFKAFGGKIWDRTTKQGETVSHSVNHGSGSLPHLSLRADRGAPRSVLQLVKNSSRKAPRSVRPLSPDRKLSR